VKEWVTRREVRSDGSGAALMKFDFERYVKYLAEQKRQRRQGLIMGAGCNPAFHGQQRQILLDLGVCQIHGMCPLAMFVFGPQQSQFVTDGFHQTRAWFSLPAIGTRIRLRISFIRPLGLKILTLHNTNPYNPGATLHNQQQEIRFPCFRGNLDLIWNII
jgi:hypothetical protein